ncbi:MAG: hypothetical protein B7Y40_06320 [Gammaproteobacteria bacterium 28-57-27]|nr:MAG: hypothetical protein B7Y40_06320 [Gammaproteobacteria bacterium 28-57-27]
MKTNVGFVDMFIRLFLGVTAIGMAVAGVFPAPWGMIIGIVGIVPIATALLKFCPLYTLLGISTKSKDADAAH